MGGAIFYAFEACTGSRLRPLLRCIDALTSASNVMKKLVQKKIVNANLAARNSNDMWLIRRAEMHAFKMAVRYLQAVRFMPLT